MLVQTNQPLSRRCSPIWRTGCAAVLIILLMLISGSLGIRRASAQAIDPGAGAADKKIAEAKAAAEERDDAIAKLRAEQATLQAQLEELSSQRKQLEVELAAKRDARVKAGDLAAQTLEEKLKARREKEMADDPREADKAKQAKDRENYALQIQKDIRAGRLKARENELDPSNRPQLDLVSLANSYVDAVGNLQLAQLELDQLTATQGPEHKDVMRLSPAAKIKVEIAQKKVNIFRGIAEAAIQAAKGDMDTASRLADQGLAPKSAITEAQSRLRILEVILAQ